MLSSLKRKSSPTPPWFVSNFDSATGLVKALANCLHEKGFAGAGSISESEILAKLINLLPWQLQRRLYVMGSAKGTIDHQKLKQVQAKEFSNWVVSLYPKKKYPCLFIGSSNGSAMHLAAAMRAPWLPQTFLIPLKTPKLSPDHPIERMEWAKPWAGQLLANNPDLQLHHMMDPLQDRPMLSRTSYFRLKRLSLGKAYENFISNNLAPGGIIFLVECQKSWPVTSVDERHFFQFGGMGGFSAEEYVQGSERITKFLSKEKAAVKKWDAPKPDSLEPESEWGFATGLRQDVIRFAQEKKYQVQQIIFDEPEDFSPFVSDLYRWWYEQRGITSNRLLAEMFFLVEPYWALRSGTVPFWMVFNAQDSANRLKEYVREAKPFEEIYLLPFSNGVAGPGLATEGELNEILSMAKHKGAMLGAEPGKYPFDFGLYARYETALKENIKSRCPTDDTLSLEQLFAFIREKKNQYNIFWPYLE